MNIPQIADSARGFFATIRHHAKPADVWNQALSAGLAIGAAMHVRRSFTLWPVQPDRGTIGGSGADRDYRMSTYDRAINRAQTTSRFSTRGLHHRL